MTFKGFVGFLYKQMLSDGIEMEPYTSVQNPLKKNWYDLFGNGNSGGTYDLIFPILILQKSRR